MATSAIIILVLILAVGFYVTSIYNRLVSLKNRYLNGFAQIEVQLKRRYDLIPNLVNTAKGYLRHERETLEAVVMARNEAAAMLKAAADNKGSGGTFEQLAQSEDKLQGALGKFNMVMESYPDLKANANMMQLSEELTATENKVGFARQSYNDGVMAYNSYRQSFPPIFFAAAFGHPGDASLLEFDDSPQIQSAPLVAF
jgi:LemA protein